MTTTDISRFKNSCPTVTYNGESIGMLLFIIQRLGQVSKYDSNIPEKSPFGKIILKSGEQRWISRRKAFYGWTVEIQKEKPAPSAYRWHRKDHIFELKRA